MDELFPAAPGGLPSEPESSELTDPLQERQQERRPWELRSAQWRAWELAEMVFGPGVRVSLAGRPGYPYFRGLLNLSVPFLSLDDHRNRERLFLTWAREDPIVARVPLVFIFEPNPVAPT